jgi:hypothetical protein
VKIAPDGTPTGEPEESIAADARPQGDGKRMAVLKVAAGLIALPFDEVRKREAITDNRRIKVVAAVAPLHRPGRSPMKGGTRGLRQSTYPRSAPSG